MSSLFLHEERDCLNTLNRRVGGVTSVKIERRYLVETERRPSDELMRFLTSLFGVAFEPNSLSQRAFHRMSSSGNRVSIQVGTRPSRMTPWCSNVMLICESRGFTEVLRVEELRRYHINFDGTQPSERFVELAEHLLFDEMTEEPYSDVPRSFAFTGEVEPVRTFDVLKGGIAAIKAACGDLGIKILPMLHQYIVDESRRIGRNPTCGELFSFAQLNSPHCRHHEMNAIFEIDGVKKRKSPMQMIRDTHSHSPDNVAIAFEDNSGVLVPVDTEIFVPENPLAPSRYVYRRANRSFIFKVETHNHPSAIDPWNGMATLLAVRRDGMGTGRGGQPLDHFAGQNVGNLDIPGYRLPWEVKNAPHPPNLATPLKIAIQGSNGSSQNGNKVGNTVSLGYFDSFDQIVGGEHYAWAKPICVGGSFGFINKVHLHKKPPKKGMLMVMIGGPALWVGVSGAAGSSVDAGVMSRQHEYDSVQRDGPMVEQGNINVIRTCSEFGLRTPIQSLTDLGAGGISCAGPELAFWERLKTGVDIDIRSLWNADPSMPFRVLWCNEAQERMVLLVWQKDLRLLERICARYRCQMRVIGTITNDNTLTVRDSKECSELTATDRRSVPIKQSMSFLLGDLPRLTIKCNSRKRHLTEFKRPRGMTPDKAMSLVLSHPAAGSKQWLTEKVDHTVGGLIVRQQDVGSHLLPLSDCSALAYHFRAKKGAVKSLGVQPIKMLVNERAGVNMAVMEALLNGMAADIDWRKSAFSATWQWALGRPAEAARFYSAVEALRRICIGLGLPVPAGKDSVSANAWTIKAGRRHAIKNPGTVQITLVCNCNDINRIWTPDLKSHGGSVLLNINPNGSKCRMGGSIFARVNRQVGKHCPDIDVNTATRMLDAIRNIHQKDLAISYHDCSDGGLALCLIEMAIAGDCGIKVDVGDDISWHDDPYRLFLNEEPGCVLECKDDKKTLSRVMSILKRQGLDKHSHVIGRTSESQEVELSHLGKTWIADGVEAYRQQWEETSCNMDAQQRNADLVWKRRERGSRPQRFVVNFSTRFDNVRVLKRGVKPKMGVLCDVGTNGQDEMIASFVMANFDARRIMMTDLQGGFRLNDFLGLAWPGGFLNADVCGAGKGTAQLIDPSTVAGAEILRFIARRNTWMLGVCNGFQVMARFGILPSRAIPPEERPMLVQNDSGMFEYRQIMIKILKSNCIFTQGMEGSVLPMLIASNEGRCIWPSDKVRKMVISKGLAPFRYVDADHRVTSEYPDCPSCSPYGIAGLCSEDGRFAALMPHPERFTLANRIHYRDPEWRSVGPSPLFEIFVNARKFSD
jgi:phosphoribosylformylglycinamidine synthase